MEADDHQGGVPGHFVWKDGRTRLGVVSPRSYDYRLHRGLQEVLLPSGRSCSCPTSGSPAAGRSPYRASTVALGNLGSDRLRRPGHED